MKEDWDGQARNASTERWVKFVIVTLLSVVVPLAAGVVNMNSRLVRAETYQENNTRERMDIDRANNAILQHMADQHDAISRQLDATERLMESIAGDDVYQRELAREREQRRRGEGSTPVFGTK